jgi:Spy/CpxP family protein refolding chaperone
MVVERSTTMKMFSRLASVSLLAFALSAAACSGGNAADPNVQSAQSAMSTAPVTAQTHGPIKMFSDALGAVPLRADQRTEIEKLAADAEARHQTVAAARKDLTEALAAQVQAGAIDRAALQPKIDASAAAWKSVEDADRIALERLHAILDSSQRAQFVAALKARGAEAHGEHKLGDHKPGEHTGKHTWTRFGHDGMKQWAADLKLTDAQKDQLKQAFRAAHEARGAKTDGGRDFRAEMKAHHDDAQKMWDAFKSDTFVMDQVARKKDPAAMADKMGDRMIEMAQVAVPILTPEQRTIAAQKIRAHAERVPAAER